MTGSAGQQRVPAQFLEEVPIPLPPLPEQERIVTRLFSADRIRRLRRAALDQSESFLQSVFLEMFVANTDAKDWPIVAVESLAKPKLNTIRTGPFGSQLLHSEFVDKGIAVLGIDNAVNNRFEWGKLRFITPEKYDVLRRYTVLPRDVIITIMGTLGRCAIVPNDIPLAINTKHLCCISLDHKKCLPEYLWASLLFDPTIKAMLEDAQRGAIMDGLNMTVIKELQVRVPTLSLQAHFADFVRRHERIHAQHREGLRQAEHLFQSLLHQAFGEAIAD